MKWIIQNNLWNEEKYQQFIDTINKLEIDYHVVKIVPFSYEMEPDVDVNGPVIVYGSTTLTRIAKDRNWKPGAFFNENFEHRKWVENWGNHVLNFDAEIVEFGKASFEGVKFIRPIDDLKIFSGELIRSDEFDEWKERCLNYHTLLTENQLIVIADPKKIYTENRLFVVDGKIVTGSCYKRGWFVINDSADEDAIDFGKEMCNIWQPDRAFCLDVALTDIGYKIVEINCINSCGFYGSDVSKLVQSLNSMEF